MFEEVETSTKDVTMGYVLMNVMDDCYLKHGPKTISQVINIRSINDAYLKVFASNMKKHSLRNCTSKHAITIGMHWSFINCSCLAASNC